MDDSALQIYTILFVAITILLVYSSRVFHARRTGPFIHGGRGALPGFKRLPGWVGRAIESGSPLHLSFGSAGIDAENAAVAAAEAELFYHVIKTVQSGDVAPVISASSPATIPLCQDTLRRAWPGEGRRARAQWLPQGQRSMAFAAGLTATMSAEQPAAHILAGSFGPELALILDSARRQGQGSLSVSDQLEGSAVAYAMADEVLIGEQLYSAAARLSHDSAARADASAQDAWRGILIALMAILMLTNVTGQLGFGSLPLLVGAALALIALGIMFFRSR